jgi:hypothetical protein
MIPASGAGGHGFNSRIAPCFFSSSVLGAMAQWQRVGFQTRRLGVQFPLASLFFSFFFKVYFILFYLFI